MDRPTTEQGTNTFRQEAKKRRDIHHLDIFRSRLPMDIFRKIFEDVDNASLQYGRMENHKNEEARSRYITSVSGPFIIDSSYV